MLLFRSEERVSEWCRRRGVDPRPLVTMPQLWHLADAWYSTRLEPNARRPGPDEIRGIFARIGLADPFWDPQADTFAGPC
ncbi:MAG TPA: hypothetical protein VJQ44_18905 [Gemmatimonadales bacterium]|nr:hypothetical protein [Gemmatimonadales bacterium]